MTKKIIILFIVIGLVGMWLISRAVYSDNIQGNAEIELYIPSGVDFSELMEIIENKEVLRNNKSFEVLAEKMNYPELIKPGRYVLDGRMSNRDLLIKLRRGEQDPIDLVIHNEKTKEELAGKVAYYLEADSLSFLNFLNDQTAISKYGYTKYTVMTAFIPNTYNVYWNTGPEQLFERMLHEKGKFWTAERKDLADKISLSEEDVFILASIVEEEISVQSEAAKVAGVYLNRLRKGMLLQADPTVKFAVGDPGIRRLLNADKKIDSPYNTYMYKGLPPGPICLPSIKTIDAVLKAEKHNYYYFCAKIDDSGEHHFSSTYDEHLKYARKYQASLNQQKIYR